MKTELIRLLRARSFQYSATPKFKLVSGKYSKYYVNCKPVTLSPRGMFVVGRLIFEEIKSLKASVQHAKDQLSYTELEAPFEDVVSVEGAGGVSPGRSIP